MLQTPMNEEKTGWDGKFSVKGQNSTKINEHLHIGLTGRLQPDA
jgi:hypothetical protein